MPPETERKLMARRRRIRACLRYQQPQCGATGEGRKRCLVCLRGDNDLDEEPADRLGGCRVERPVERDYAAEGAHRIAGERLLPCLAQVAPY